MTASTELVPVAGTELTTDLMTIEDAQEFDKALRRGVGESKVRAYIMAQKRGYTHFADDAGIHYTSMDDYASDRLGIATTTLYDWTAQVEVTLDSKGWSVDKLMAEVKKTAKGEAQALIPTTITRKLRALPTVDLRRQVYKTMEELKTANTMTDAEFNNEWAKMVSRTMVEAGLKARPGRPVSTPAETPSENASKNGHPSDTPSSEQATVSAPPDATTGHSSVPATVEEAFTKVSPVGKFDFDDNGKPISFDQDYGLHPSDESIEATDHAMQMAREQLQDAVTAGESLGFTLEAVKAKLGCGEPMPYDTFEVTGEGVRLWFKLADGIEVCGDISDDQFKAIAEQWHAYNPAK